MKEKIIARRIYLRIKTIIKKKEISLYKLSEDLGLPKSTFYDQINNLKNGKMISWKNISKFQEKLNTNFFD